jgi:hypothetical protein
MNAPLHEELLIGDRRERKEEKNQFWRKKRWEKDGQRKSGRV